ncbi:MAG: ATP-binding cassette domain-containing protein, partial [Clostridia bacterium]|nr:ATP-binding cassette domain-containing protein [Clostridia bacterium]
GFSKVSLEFDVGEFVAITGESGSGKSTLLNVISGLDTYEEGEMYINGEETSHYTEKDFEDYRRKYIGNIFQNFNLVNSYTVYQNVELVLLLSGMKRRDAKVRANELIERCGLADYRNTKASKLSGGQKQRVAIARALAKDTPIIIADEPTGNLDSESAADIIKLLSEIAKDKLVIIVTHNFDQVEPYITRKIKMHDGKVLEDTKLREIASDIEPSLASTDNIRFFSRLRLGVRNAFNIPVKFLLLTFVFVFVTLALVLEMSIYQSELYENELLGYNYYFSNTSENRLVIKQKSDDDTAKPFDDSDIEKLSKVSNVKIVEKNDVLMDNQATFEDEHSNFYIYGIPQNIENYDMGELDYGRMPENENEILVVTTKNSYTIPSSEKGIKEFMNTELFRYNRMDWSRDMDKPFKVVGIKLINNSDSPVIRAYQSIFYLGDSVIDEMRVESNRIFSQLNIEFQGVTYDPNTRWPMFNVLSSSKVESGTCWVSDGYNAYVKGGYSAQGKDMTLKVHSKYYDDELNLTIAKIYNKSSFSSAYEMEKNLRYDDYEGYILVNEDDLKQLFDKETYQVCVFVDDAMKVDKTANDIRDLGYDVLVIKDTLYNDGSGAILQLLNKVIILGVAIVFLIISYFVIRIILKSRNVYYSTIRMLGANVGVSRSLLIIDMMVCAGIGYFVVIGAVKLLNIWLSDTYILATIAQFMTVPQYALIFAIVILISVIIGA